MSEKVHKHDLKHLKPEDRRIRLTTLFAITLAFVPLFWLARRCQWYQHLHVHEPSVEERALRILEQNPLIDGHNDLLTTIRFVSNSQIYGDDFREKFAQGGYDGQVDLARLKKGHVGGSFWSAWMPCPENSTETQGQQDETIIRSTLGEIETFTRLGDQYPHYFTLPTSAKAARQAFKDGRLISPLAIEGLHHIGNSLAVLRLYHKLGARYVTLNWNCHNAYSDAAVISNATASVISTPLWHGISAPRGRQLIHEMNRLGMIVDLAHVSADTMRDVLTGANSKNGDWEGSIAPPIFSHSSAYALCPHPRNVPDDVLELVKKRNSIVMVNFTPAFISCVEGNSRTGIPDFFPANSTLRQAVRHIVYIGQRIGYEHVGIGSDFDGMVEGPEGLEDVSKFPELVAEMLRQGISDENAAKILGRNLLRVWEEVDKVSALLKETTDPAEDDVSHDWPSQ